MIQCPECRQMIPDDSAFCDQCGKELKWCPECRRPKRGTECPVCGSDLVPGRRYHSGNNSSPIAAGNAPNAEKEEAKQEMAAPQGTNASSKPAETPSALAGNGWKLALKEGAFGRNGGIWPELGSCQYVSGSHGTMAMGHSGWMITDNGSTNGTFLNGQRIPSGSAVSIKIGDRLRIATLDFTVV